MAFYLADLDNYLDTEVVVVQSVKPLDIKSPS